MSRSKPRMQRIPVTTVSGYITTLIDVAIRRDHTSYNHAFVQAPPTFTATAEQLRHLADTFHDMADKLDHPNTEMEPA